MLSVEVISIFNDAIHGSIVFTLLWLHLVIVMRNFALLKMNTQALTKLINAKEMPICLYFDCFIFFFLLRETNRITLLNLSLKFTLLISFQEIMMDHSLRTISYIADIGDIVVIMARRRTMVTQSDIEMRRKRQSKILCHVFESEEVSLWRFFVCFPSKLIKWCVRP